MLPEIREWKGDSDALLEHNLSCLELGNLSVMIMGK